MIDIGSRFGGIFFTTFHVHDEDDRYLGLMITNKPLKLWHLVSQVKSF